MVSGIFIDLIESEIIEFESNWCLVCCPADLALQDLKEKRKKIVSRF